ncbi:MAG: hypothetical protein ACO31Z_05770, partial [Litorivicinaceae bacterium]
CKTVFATIWFSLCLADIKQIQCQSKINLSSSLSARHGKCLNIPLTVTGKPPGPLDLDLGIGLA